MVIPMSKIEAKVTATTTALSGLEVNRCSYYPAAYIAGQTTKESMAKVK